MCCLNRAHKKKTKPHLHPLHPLHPRLQEPPPLHPATPYTFLLLQLPPFLEVEGGQGGGSGGGGMEGWKVVEGLEMEGRGGGGWTGVCGGVRWSR